MKKQYLLYLLGNDTKCPKCRALMKRVYINHNINDYGWVCTDCGLKLKQAGFGIAENEMIGEEV